MGLAARHQWLHVQHLGFLALIWLLLASAQCAFAQPHGGGGHGARAMDRHGGGWHGGRGSGSEWWGLGMGLGFGWGIANRVEPYPYGYPYAYYSDPAYYYSYRGPYPGYEQRYRLAPLVEPPADRQYAPGQVLAPAGNWYYCDSARGYYPYVTQCPEAWRAVSAVPPGPTQ
jgi:hypothetical protein